MTSLSYRSPTPIEMQVEPRTSPAAMPSSQLAMLQSPRSRESKYRIEPFVTGEFRDERPLGRSRFLGLT
jgi:hypothetical protein